MLLTRIREAGADGLTSRIALALAGAATACLSVWLVLDAAGQPPYQMLFVGLGFLGIYLVGVAIFSRSAGAKTILLSYFFAPVGILCIALAMPLAALIRYSKTVFRI